MSQSTVLFSYNKSVLTTNRIQLKSHRGYSYSFWRRLLTTSYIQLIIGDVASGHGAFITVVFSSRKLLNFGTVALSLLFGN